MDPGDDATVDDAANTVDMEAPTAPQLRPVVAPDKQPTEAPAPEPRSTGARRLWFPLALFVVLLAAAAAVGAVVGPGSGPAPGAAPRSLPPTGAPTGAPTSAEPSVTSPALLVPSGPVRPADALGPWAAEISERIGVPDVAVQAYGYAQLLMESTTPSCHLGWTTLAGIGAVESDNGRSGGSVLQRSGRTNPPIVGPPLDGQDGRPLVADTDAGAFDGDATFDRRMGPLQLLPSQWQAHESDADDDQIMDPYDIDDASLAVARLLCANGGDLSTRSGWRAAVGKLTEGDAFADAVFQAADSYGQRTKNIE